MRRTRCPASISHLPTARHHDINTACTARIWSNVSAGLPPPHTAPALPRSLWPGLHDHSLADSSLNERYDDREASKHAAINYTRILGSGSRPSMQKCPRACPSRIPSSQPSIAACPSHCHWYCKSACHFKTANLTRVGRSWTCGHGCGPVCLGSM